MILLGYKRKEAALAFVVMQKSPGGSVPLTEQDNSDSYSRKAG